jgi:hypothetical protein
MKNKIILILMLTSFLVTFQYTNAQCPIGVDIHIANDVSGSVDSREFQQSKDFVSLLGANFGTAYGTGNLETRVSISNWSRGTGRFVEYDFPTAGQDYAITISDILSYTTSSRPFSGGTDVYTALLRAREWVNQSPVSGRTAPKIIVLLTDASCGQVANNISSLATQIKNEGTTIVVLAIDNAASCANLAGTNVASPGGYFNAQDYQTLQNQAINFINDLRDATCVVPPPNPFDLTINLSNFTIEDCFTNPVASVEYSVTNISDGENFNDNLQVSFYNGDPTLPGTKYLFTTNTGNQNISSNGGVFNAGTVTDPSLKNTNTLYAIVNYNGGVTGNEVPIIVNNLAANLAVTDEQIAANNISTPITRVDAPTCVPFATIDVNVSNSGQVCDNEIIYFVEICNTGNLDATLDQNTDIIEYAPADYTFISKQLVGNDPFIGTTLPAGECAIFEYTYNLDNAVNGTNYNYSVDVNAVAVNP